MTGSAEQPGARDVSGLDASATLSLAEEVLRRRRRAELDDLVVAAHWAALHSTDPRHDGAKRVWAEDRLIAVGGEGSPRVREFCIAELAMVRQVHPLTGQALIADVLDLQHRLPLVWAKVASLEAEAWVARKVASMTRAVPLAVIDVVDRAVAAIIGTESPTRVLTVAQAKIMEADPVGTAEKAEAERRRRYVTLSRADEHGLRHVIARVTAGDAHWVDVMVDRVADLIAPDHPGRIATSSAPPPSAGSPGRRTSWSCSSADGAAMRQPATRHRDHAVLYVHLHEASVAGLSPASPGSRGSDPSPSTGCANSSGTPTSW